MQGDRISAIYKVRADRLLMLMWRLMNQSLSQHRQSEQSVLMAAIQASGRLSASVRYVLMNYFNLLEQTIWEVGV